MYIDLQFHKCNSPALIASRCMQLLCKCRHTTLVPLPPDQCLSGFVHLPSMSARPVCVRLELLYPSSLSANHLNFIPLLTYLSFQPTSLYFSVEALSCHYCTLHPFQQVIKIIIAAIVTSPTGGKRCGGVAPSPRRPNTSL